MAPSRGEESTLLRRHDGHPRRVEVAANLQLRCRTEDNVLRRCCPSQTAEGGCCDLCKSDRDEKNAFPRWEQSWPFLEQSWRRKDWPTGEPWGILRGMERELDEDRDGRAGPERRGGAAACREGSQMVQSNHVGQTQQVSPGESTG
jgi:hypothetical protein